jgi:hypothetical protein
MGHQVDLLGNVIDDPARAWDQLQLAQKSIPPSFFYYQTGFVGLFAGYGVPNRNGQYTQFVPAAVPFTHMGDLFIPEVN